MAEKYDVGTPIGGERKSRRLHSPLQEMDGVDRQLSFEEEEEPVPATPVGAHAGHDGGHCCTTRSNL